MSTGPTRKVRKPPRRVPETLTPNVAAPLSRRRVESETRVRVLFLLLGFQVNSILKISLLSIRYGGRSWTEVIVKLNQRQAYVACWFCTPSPPQGSSFSSFISHS